MKNALTKKALADFRDMIVQVRGVSVILDSDLAQAYGVTTGALNQAVKRNIERFPSDFMITLTIREAKEIRLLRSQFVILEPKDHPKYPPKAFTEHGALMAATILNSPQAVRMSVFVVRAFVAMHSSIKGSPVVESLVGALGSAKVSEETYKKHLREKYQ